MKDEDIKNAHSDIIRLLWRLQGIPGFSSIQGLLLSLTGDPGKIVGKFLNIESQDIIQIYPFADSDLNAIIVTILEIYFIIHRLEFHNDLSGYAVGYTELYKSYQDLIKEFYLVKCAEEFSIMMVIYQDIILYASELMTAFIVRDSLAPFCKAVVWHRDKSGRIEKGRVSFSLIPNTHNILGGEQTIALQEYQQLQFLDEAQIFAPGVIKKSLYTSRESSQLYAAIPRLFEFETQFLRELREIEPNYQSSKMKHAIIVWVYKIFCKADTTILQQLTALRLIEFIGGRTETRMLGHTIHHVLSVEEITLPRLCSIARTWKTEWIKQSLQKSNSFLKTLTSLLYNFIA